MGPTDDGAASAHASADLRVVLVDDDPDFRLILRARLNLLPGIVVAGTAGDGEEALAVVDEVVPDVVVVDLLMPGIDGYATIERLRAEHPDVAAVAYTAVSVGAARERVAALGVELVQKTREPAGLVEAIRRSVVRGDATRSYVP